MKNENEINNELADLSPTLRRLRDESDGLKTPDHYFDYLTDSVMEQIKLGSQPSAAPPVPKQSWWSQFFLSPTQWSVGLATLLLIGLSLWWSTNSSVEPILAEVSPDDAFYYLEDNLSDFESELLVTELEWVIDTDEALIDAEVDYFLNENLPELGAVDLETIL